MNAQELRIWVSDYERYNNIYMNFSVDEHGIWGLPEGDKTQHLLTDERVKKYQDFLDKAITHYETMLRFFNSDPDLTRKKDKYNQYKKRLNNAIKKNNKQSA
jgi:hypothetical protein